MSDSKFDDKIRETLKGHEPEATPNWGKMRDRIAAAAAIGAMGVDAAGSKIATQLSIGAAVVLGAASMWIAQQFVELEEKITEDVATDVVELEDETINSSESNIALFEESEIDKTTQVNESNTDVAISNSASIASEPTQTNTQQSTEPVNPTTSASEIQPIDDPEIVEVPFNSSTQTSCVGAQVSFEVEGSDKSMSFLWNFGDGSFSSEPNPSHTYEMPGVYDVTLSLRSPGEGSIKTRTIENLITINPQPEADMTWTFPRIVTGEKVPLELIDQTLNANDATWIVDGEILSTASPQIDNPGKYQVNLIASNQYGCQDHTSKSVIVGNRNSLNAPARFSPDGDGRYDSFMPFDLNGMSEKWELVISDITGNEVYSTTSFDKPWTGEISGGELASNAQLFYWTVLCTDFDGNQRLYTDKVTVER